MVDREVCKYDRVRCKCCSSASGGGLVKDGEGVADGLKGEGAFSAEAVGGGIERDDIFEFVDGEVGCA